MTFFCEGNWSKTIISTGGQKEGNGQWKNLKSPSPEQNNIRFLQRYSIEIYKIYPTPFFILVL